MLNKMKYKLLCWLLRDICSRSDCSKCKAVIKDQFLCCRSFVVMQARDVWQIGGGKDG